MTPLFARICCLSLALLFYPASALKAQDTELAKTLDAGCSGGYNGAGSGVLVSEQGHIQGWSLPSYRDPMQLLTLRTDSQVAQELFADMQAMHFTTIAYRKPANMSCFLRLLHGQQEIHKVQWPFGNSEAPAPVLRLFQKIRALARSTSQ